MWVRISLGICNSSEHRVRLVFNALRARDATGLTWLSPLLGLPTRKGRERLILGPEDIGPLEFSAWSSPNKKGEVPLPPDPKWQPKERKLPAPQRLLHELVDTITRPHTPEAWGDGDTETKRRLLAARDPKTRAQAHDLLDGPPRPRRWELLEGPSCPDVYLRTATTIVVIEGKFTERAPTTYTTWMAGRHQMLRHLDAAWEERGGRKVYGFFIVEYPASSGWAEASELTVKDDSLRSSLPHRDRAALSQIADSFLGITDWCSVSETLRLPHDLLVPEIDLRRRGSA